MRAVNMTRYTHIFKKIQEAQDVLKDIARVTPLDRSTTFSKITGGDVYLKLENLQKTGSFKVRGAAFAMSKLTPKQRKAGVIAASAGNHAQGIAYAASRLGIAATIVMPSFSPVAKVQATRGYGAEVILYGSAFDDALAKAMEISKTTGATFMHPFNDENVIAGQGTVGLEILNELPNVDVVAVPIGGGGLSAGIAIAMKELKPDVEIYGVEAATASSMRASIEAGEVVGVENLDTICDGIAVKKVGDLTYPIAKELLSGVVTVEDPQVTRTLFHLLERAKLVVEPAGCVGLSAFEHGIIDIHGKKAVAVLSGGNIDMSFMARMVEKELFSLHHLVRVRGQIFDRVGSLNKVLDVVTESGVNIIEIQHDRYDPDIPPNRAEILMILEVPEESALERLFDLLEKKGMHFEVFEE